MAFCRGLCERALPPGRLRLLSTRIVAVGLLPRVRPWDRTVELTTPPSWPPTTAVAPQMPPNATNQSFPTLLVVTTSVLVEAGLAHQAYLAQQRYGHAAVFLSDDAGSYPCPPRDGSGSDLALSGAVLDRDYSSIGLHGWRGYRGVRGAHRRKQASSGVPHPAERQQSGHRPRPQRCVVSRERQRRPSASPRVRQARHAQEALMIA